MPEQQSVASGAGVDLEPQHFTNHVTSGFPHEAGPERCWCLDSVEVLHAEVARLLAQVAELTAEHADMHATCSALPSMCPHEERLERAKWVINGTRELYGLLQNYQGHHVITRTVERVGRFLAEYDAS